MAPSFDAVAQKNSVEVTNGTTWNHTCDAAATILFVGGVQTQGDTTPYRLQEATYNAEAMTQLNYIITTAGGDNITVELWYILNPASGTNEVSITNCAATGFGCWISASYKGVNTADPLGTEDEQESGSASSIVASVTSTCMIVSIGGKHYDEGSMSVDGDSTERAEAYCSGQAANDRESRCNWADRDDAGSIGITHYIDGAVNRPIACITVPLKPAPTGTQAIFIMAERWKNFMKDLRRGTMPPQSLEEKYGQLLSI